MLYAALIVNSNGVFDEGDQVPKHGIYIAAQLYFLPVLAAAVFAVSVLANLRDVFKNLHRNQVYFRLPCIRLG